MIEFRNLLPPQLPPEVVNRFPEVAGYNQSLMEWWDTVCETLGALEDKIETATRRVSDENKSSLEATKTELTDTISTVRTSITDLDLKQSSLRETVSRIASGDLP